MLATVCALGMFSGAPQAQSGDSVAKQFIGMWRLVSRPQKLTDGTTRQYPISVGYIIYTDTGRMCYVAMDPSRPKWASDTPTSAEALSGMNGLGAYCATVEVHAAEGFVVHHVEIDRSPNFVGRDRKRFFKFETPNRVALRIDPIELKAPIVEDTLIWERVQK